MLLILIFGVFVAVVGLVIYLSGGALSVHDDEMLAEPEVRHAVAARNVVKVAGAGDSRAARGARRAERHAHRPVA
ncbi:MAG TPA: hypothetical protein VGM91_09430 [Conexibacter sp.]